MDQFSSLQYHIFFCWQKDLKILCCRVFVLRKPNSNNFLVDSLVATSLFKMLLKYRPEDKAAKKERLMAKAKAEAEGKAAGIEAKKPIVVKYGLNHVTYLIEQVFLSCPCPFHTDMLVLVILFFLFLSLI